MVLKGKMRNKRNISDTLLVVHNYVWRMNDDGMDLYITTNQKRRAGNSH